MTKVFLNSNPDLGKCSSSIDVLWDQHENLLSSCIDLESKVQPENHSRDFISLTRKLQTRCFRWVWFKFSEIVYLKTKPWPVKTCKHVNVISLNTIFLCYLVIDKATSNMYKVQKNYQTWYNKPCLFVLSLYLHTGKTTAQIMFW